MTRFRAPTVYLITAFVLGMLATFAARPLLSPAAQTNPANDAFAEELDPIDDAPAEQMGVVHSRMAAKHWLAGELIEGRMPVADVLAQFRQMQEAETGFWVQMRVLHPGAGDDELLGLNILTYVEVASNGRPDQRAVLARIRSELNSLTADQPRRRPA
jgi:hypothetical protein